MLMLQASADTAISLRSLGKTSSPRRSTSTRCCWAHVLGFCSSEHSSADAQTRQADALQTSMASQPGMHIPSSISPSMAPAPMPACTPWCCGRLPGWCGPQSTFLA